MVKSFPLAYLRRPSAGLLLMVSLGFHGFVLTLPTLNSSPDAEALSTLLPPSAPDETIEVVRLPNSAQTLPPATPPPPKPATPATPPRPRPPGPPSSAPDPTAAPPLVPAPTALPAPSANQNPPTPEPAPPTPEAAPPEPAPIPPGLTYNHQTVELSTATEDFLTWYNEQNWDDLAAIPFPSSQELATLQVPYTGEVCLSTPPAPGRLEVIVGNDGQLARPPRLLATTGYDDLDAAALELAAQQTYPAPGNPNLSNPTVYWLPMEVMNNGPTCTTAQAG